MSKKQILIGLITVSSLFSVNAQQIGDGWAPVITDFGHLLQSGVYNGVDVPGGVLDNSHPWQHLFVIRHPNPNNNHQFQLATSFAENDKLFFRKIAGGDLSLRSPVWIELATRGSNSFLGDQSFMGNIGIGTLFPKDKVEIYGGGNLLIKGANEDAGDLIFQSNAEMQLGRVWTENSGISGLYLSSGDNTPDITINQFGSVGIGTTDPGSYKLAVEGKIGAHEVVVTTQGWADFVFESDYNLMSLKELEAFIKTNKHLPEIPTAAEVKENGISVGEMNAKLLQKIEELTLYVIELKKENEEIKKQANSLIQD